jgi:hypothetical protein
MLRKGEWVIVAVDAEELWEPGVHPERDDRSGDPLFAPGQDANHAVQVIGIDRSDPGRPMVVLNDPGHPDGRGMLVPLDEFAGAWQDSGCFAVHTGGGPGVQ